MPLLQADRDKLAKIMGMTTSSAEGEQLAALRQANKLLKERQMTWAEVLARAPATASPPPQPPPRQEHPKTAAPNRPGASERHSRQDTGKSREDIRWEAFEGKDPERAEWIDNNANHFDFAESLYHGVRKYGRLTPNQEAAVDRCIARDKLRDAG
jgi:hypothetical protein